MAADGANPRQTSEGVATPRWLPDGSGILYVGLTDYQLYVMWLRGRARKLPVAIRFCDDAAPSVADGKWVVYQSVAKGSGAGNIRCGRDSSQWRRIAGCFFHAAPGNASVPIAVWPVVVFPVGT